MSREISISYRIANGQDVPIEIRAPYFLLGTQQTSRRFWGLARLKEIGIERLTILGETDPIGFWGWDDMLVLDNEIKLLANHLASIEFDVEIKASWLSHLTYCFNLLAETAPKDSEPVFSIG